MNVNGNLAIKLRRPPVVSLIKSCHILLLQETWLRPDEHAVLQKDVPEGYKLISLARPARYNMDHGYGGVAAVVHESLEYTLRADLSGADQMVLETPSAFVVCSYLPCANTRIDTATWTIVEPSLKLRELVTGLRLSGKLVYVVGDMNGRTGGERALDAHPVRESRDKAPCNTRGRWLLQTAAENSMCILNGAISADLAAGGRLTSYQGNGNSIVDYALLSDEHLDNVLHFSVEPLLSAADHAVLHVRLDIPVHTREPVQRSKPPLEKADIPVFDPESAVDTLLEEVMSDVRTWDQSMRDLYGPLLTVDKNPLFVWTDGSCLDNRKPTARAGAGVFWGEDCPKNMWRRLHGTLQTNNRAELFAILLALDACAPDRALTLYSDSEYAIRSIAEWAPARADVGWTCKNGDILQQICALILRRTAGLHLVWVKAHDKNAHNNAADALAKRGAELPPASSPYLPDLSPLDHSGLIPVSGQLKVTTALAPLRPKPGEISILQHEPDLHNEPWFTLRNGRRTQNPSLWHMRWRDSHRTRAIDADIRHANLMRLLAADSPQKFWALMTEWCKPGRVPQEADGDLLEDVFRVRLMGPETAPLHFDRNFRDLIAHVVAELPPETEDFTTDQLFSREFTEVEVASGKSRILLHLKTARGIDRGSYSDILSLSNARIAELLTMCLRDRVIPTAWKAALLAAVPKAKGPYTDPENYRMIALECCMLKLMTLLLEARIRDFVEREGSLPHSQNGFRQGYRTENNPFIVRVAMETAHRLGKPLYVSFVDFRNAFPSVDRAILWAKMLDMGISGPVFDWLRTLYTDMRYYLQRDGGVSNPMRADLGILMGDPASPLAFLMYVSDFTTPTHADDIVMMDKVIAHLEHADDLALMSMSAEGLQQKLDSLAAWASQNQMEVNTSKTVVMIFYPPRKNRPPEVPTFHLYDQQLLIVDKYKYVGVMLCSTGGNTWDEMVSTCAKSSRRAANMCFFVESRTGQLPPWEGRMLYSAQLDSRLTHAVEVTGVGTNKQLEQLESVQLYYIRRLLGLQTRSQKCVLYSETGILPLRTRRLELVLGYLVYLLGLPDAHYAKRALLQTIENSQSRRSGWWHDLREGVEKLGLQLPIDITASDAQALRKRVVTLAGENIADEIRNSPKLEILRERVEFGAQGNKSSPSLSFRPYLRIANKAARQAITRTLLSDHRLAVETGRWEGVDRTDRKCRLCDSAVEDPLHVLFECARSDDLLDLRRSFWDEIEVACEEASAAIRALAVLRVADNARAARLRLQLIPAVKLVFILLTDARTTSILAVFTHRVLTFFDSLPPRRYPGGRSQLSNAG